jgi:cellulose synthase/poly-beta-1,6-N-acetylglucosamine synthase-like glycosyltransferase
MHINESIPVTITHVKENRKKRRKKKFCVDTMIILDIFISLYNEESFRSSNNIVPKHFMYGPRKLNVILTQLRCSASFLNNDLFKSNIVSSPNCACDVPR